MNNIQMNENNLNAVLNIYMESFNKYFSVQELQLRELRLIFDEFNKKARDLPNELLYSDNNDDEYNNYSSLNRMRKSKLPKETRKKSGYNLFLSEYSKSHLHDKTRFADAGVAWKELNDNSRKMYNEQAKVANSLVIPMDMNNNLNMNMNNNLNMNNNMNLNNNYHHPLSNPTLHDSLLRNNQLQQQHLLHSNQLQLHSTNQMPQQQLYHPQHHHLQQQHHGIINNNINIGNNMNIGNSMNMGNIDDDSSYLKAALEKERRIKEQQAVVLPISVHSINENRVDRLNLKRGSATVVDDEAERRRKKEKKGLQTFDSLGGDDF